VKPADSYSTMERVLHAAIAAGKTFPKEQFCGVL